MRRAHRRRRLRLGNHRLGQNQQAARRLSGKGYGRRWGLHGRIEHLADFGRASISPWARERSRRAICSKNMQRIGSALYAYTRNYESGFPPNLNTLLSDGHVTEKLLVCPSSDAVVGDLDACYEFIALTPDPSDFADVIMYEKEGCHGGEGGNVLFADGHVQFMLSHSGVQKLVQETRDRLAKPQTKR
ncbi:MAG: DUF1559 domain-containing protein [Planctomycetota bacterium]|nr:DUF1559 domain-containing protein [Planctomycetota bacterium]